MRRDAPTMYEYTKEAWSKIEPGIEFRDGLHIPVICNHLQHSIRTPRYRLDCNMPPGCMKSILFSVVWPTYTWGPYCWPESNWFFASYSAELSKRDSIKARNLLDSSWFQKQWPWVKFSKDENRQMKYTNLRGGWRFSTSVSGGGTGQHPDFIVIDDSITAKNSESARKRKTVTDWFDGTLRTRGASRGARVANVMQRFHQGDLSGHIQRQGGWDRLVLPMRAVAYSERQAATALGWVDPREPGELLFPALFPEELVKQLEIDLGSLRTAGQLQQTPVTAGGLAFKVEKIGIVPTLPKIVAAARYWDKAGTPGGGDWSVGVLLGKCEQGRWYVIDVVRGQWSPFDREDIIKATTKADWARYSHVNYRVIFEQEPGSAGLESAQRSVAMVAGIPAAVDKVSDAKKVRWQAFSAAVEAGLVSLLSAGWNRDFLDELMIAPKGEHDDQVDSASGAYSYLTGDLLSVEDWLRLM